MRANVLHFLIIDVIYIYIHIFFLLLTILFFFLFVISFQVRYIVETNMDSEDAQDLEMTFSEEDRSGNPIPLIKNGEKIRVTEKNKFDYIRRLCEYRLVTFPRPLLQHMRAGFCDVVGELNLDQQLTAEDLRILICGESKISVDDLIRYETKIFAFFWLIFMGRFCFFICVIFLFILRNIVVQGTEENNATIQMFFSFLRRLSQEDLSLFGYPHFF